MYYTLCITQVFDYDCSIFFMLSTSEGRYTTYVPMVTGGDESTLHLLCFVDWGRHPGVDMLTYPLMVVPYDHWCPLLMNTTFQE